MSLERPSAPLDLWADHPVAHDLARDPRRAASNADHLCQALAGINYNPDAALVPLRPFVFPAAVRSSLDAASRELARIIHRACWALTGDPAELARRVGLSDDQVPFVGASGHEHEIDYGTCNGRFDVVLRDGAPVFLEANFGAANMDPVVMHAMLAAYRDLYGIAPRSDPQSVAEPFEARARLYRRLCRERNLPETVAVVGTLKGTTAGDRRYYEAESTYLRSVGIASEFVGPPFFEDAGNHQRYSIALKHFMSEYWRYMELPVEAIKAAHAHMIFLVPDVGYALSSKLVFAWLSDGTLPLSAADGQFVQRHVPWTRQTGRRDVEFEGRHWELAKLAVARQADFVLKPLNSSGGQGVLLGRDVDPAAWRHTLTNAVNAQDHVLQRFVDADPLGMDFFDRDAGKVRHVGLSYVLGSYLVDGLSAGVSVRHFAGDARRIVNVAQGASFNLVL